MKLRSSLVWSLVLIAGLLASSLLLAQAPEVAASGVAAAGVAGMPEKPGFAVRLIQLLPMLAILFVIFYLMVFKPQSVQARAQQDLLTNLKKGQAVVTSSGLIGRVAGVESDHVLLEIAANVKVKVESAHIKKRYEKDPVPAAKAGTTFE